MTPKEKAEELVGKMVATYDITSDFCYDSTAKQCALIAVEEIIESEPRHPSIVDWDDAGGTFKDYYEAQREEVKKYWEEVKQELNNL